MLAIATVLLGVGDGGQRAVPVRRRAGIRGERTRPPHAVETVTRDRTPAVMVRLISAHNPPPPQVRPLQPGATEAVVKVAAITFAAIPVLTTASPFAQIAEPPQPSQPPVVRSGSALAALSVTVQDPSAKYVAGLQRADFAVYEDGIKQDVRFFESTAVPVDLIVRIDISSSRSDEIDIGATFPNRTTR